MTQLQQWIEIHPEAPAKPEEGAPCNGCGVCCLAEPCPLGMVLSGKRVGACVAVRWDSDAGCYRCGALQAPTALVHAALPVYLRWLYRPVAWCVARMAPRWIAQGVGCDCSLRIDTGIRDNASHD